MSSSKIASPAGSTKEIETLPRAAVATMLSTFDARYGLVMPRSSFAQTGSASGSIERGDVEGALGACPRFIGSSSAPANTRMFERASRMAASRTTSSSSDARMRFSRH